MFLYTREAGLLFLTALFFLLQTFFLMPVPVKNTEYIPPPPEVKYLALGLQHQFSDSFWLRAIQDTQYCEEKVGENLCAGGSWFYNVINLVIELDPQFIEAYYYGGLTLSFLIRDVSGASIVFDKATGKFKYDWPLLYLAAYHALFEEHDKVKASRLYLGAANSGAPAWVRLSAGRLAAEGGEEKAAEEILQHLIETESDPRWVKRLREQLDGMNKKKTN